jgi:hypothetical protein
MGRRSNVCGAGLGLGSGLARLGLSERREGFLRMAES